MRWVFCAVLTDFLEYYFRYTSSLKDYTYYINIIAVLCSVCHRLNENHPQVRLTLSSPALAVHGPSAAKLQCSYGLFNQVYCFDPPSPLIVLYHIPWVQGYSGSFIFIS